MGKDFHAFLQKESGKRQHTFDLDFVRLFLLHHPELWIERGLIKARTIPY